MKNYAQAMHQIINQGYKPATKKKCSLIPYEEAKNLYRTRVKLREISSQVEFEAFVTDTCCDDQKGIIVAFDKKVAKELHCKDFGPADANPKAMVEMDLRNIYSGKHFELIYDKQLYH